MMGDNDRAQAVCLDDTERTRELTKDILESIGRRLDVHTASSIEEALNTINAENIHCVVTSHHTNDHSLDEIITAIRNDHPALPIILYTTQCDEMQVQEAFDLGVTDYFEKSSDKRVPIKLYHRILSASSAYQHQQAASKYKAELHRTEQSLRHIENLTKAGSWELDTEEMDLTWSENLKSLYNHDNDNPTIEETLELYQQSDRQIIKQAVQNAITNKESFRVTLETNTLSRDEELHRLEVTGTPIIDDDGQVTAVRGAAHDRTQNWRREQTLRTICEIVANPTTTFDQKANALLDLGRREIGTEFAAVSCVMGDTYEFEYATSADHLQGLMQTGDALPEQKRNCPHSLNAGETIAIADIETEAPDLSGGFTHGEITPNSYLGAPIYVNGERYGTVCFFSRDTHDNGFTKWNKTLAKLLGQLAGTGIQQHQTTANLKDRNEQLERFSALVSHGLQNPLDVATLCLSLERENRDNERLATAAEAHNQMYARIDELLELATDGKQINSLKPTSIEETALEAAQTVGMGSCPTTVTEDLTIKADPNQLQRLFENLIANAAEHGGDNIQITIGPLDDGFYIEDDGTGIPEHKRGEIFDAGYTTTEDSPGIGLTLVQDIVNSHNWQIAVTEGRVGGARFEITGVERPKSKATQSATHE